MSGTTNEYHNPGGNHPDKGGTWSGPVSDDTASAPGTQDGPVQDMNAPTVDEKIEGIIAQSRVDLSAHGDQDVELLVRRRLEDAGIPATDDDVARIVTQVSDAGDGTRPHPGVHPDR